jgi:small multidrug resistance family-3 protein
VIVLKSVALFVLAALLEIGGAWLVWQGVREHRGWAWVGAGVIALGAYGFVAAFQPDAHFGRVLAAYGGVFIAGSLAWGMVADGFRADPRRATSVREMPAKNTRVGVQTRARGKRGASAGCGSTRPSRHRCGRPRW